MCALRQNEQFSRYGVAPQGRSRALAAVVEVRRENKTRRFSQRFSLPVIFPVNINSLKKLAVPFIKALKACNRFD